MKPKVKYVLWWASEDKQGSLNMGEYKTEKQALAAQPAMLKELIDQCALDEENKPDKKEVSKILAGDWHVEKKQDTDWDWNA